MRVLRERRSVLVLEPLLVAADQIDPVIGRKIGVERVAIPVVCTENSVSHVVVMQSAEERL
jgi:hypothetical protein